VLAQVCAEVAGSEVVAPANFNSPGQTVIAGHSAAVDRALAALAARGVRKSVRLPVSVPSHTALMQGAAARLAERMAAIAWREPELPVVQNVDAATHVGIDAVRAALVAQLHRPVQWIGCVQALLDQGVTRVAECGPGKVLAGLVRRIARDADVRALGSAADLDAALADWR
jgi:[acyl-carrier-protein] S-malonyltransferase